MKNDYSLHPLNPSSSILIRDTFAKSFTIKFSIIATIAPGNETVNNNGETVNNIKLTLASTGAIVNNVVATAAGNKETVGGGEEMTACGKEMANSFEETVLNIRSNTVHDQRNDEMLSCQYASMVVAIRYSVEEIRFSIVSIPINVSINTIFLRVNTHQCSCQYGLRLRKWATRTKKSPTKPVLSMSLSKKYDTAIAQQPPMSLAA